VTRLSILIPVFNEIRTLDTLLEAVISAPLPCKREIVIVDDCSQDGSREKLREFAGSHSDVKLILHEVNQGKGAAIRTAIEHMTGDWAIIQDADLEYDPRDYARLLEPAMEGIADAVFGSRFLVDRYALAMFFWHALINKSLTLLTNIITDLNLTDMETCYKLIRANTLKQLIIRSNGFDLEPELSVKLARWGARICEVPISYRGRTYAEGKKIGVRDAIAAIIAIFRYAWFDTHYCKNELASMYHSMSRARWFNRWIVNQFRKDLGDEVMILGSGIAGIAYELLDRKRIVCLEHDDDCAERLQHSLGHLLNLSVSKGGMNEAAIGEALKQHAPVDSIICFHTLEHIEDEAEKLKLVIPLLRPGGKLFVIAPHGKSMYSGLDKSLGLKRRYAAEELRELMEQAGLQVETCSKFNRLGGLGWRISGNLLHKTAVSPAQMRMFEYLMPIVPLLDMIPFHTHNTLICVGVNPNISPDHGEAE